VSAPSRSRVTMLVSLAIAAVLLYLAFRGIDWRPLVAQITAAEPAWLVLGFLGYTVAIFTRGMRWRILVTAAAPVAPTTAFWATALGYAGNSFLPARAGEVLRSVALARSAGTSVGFVFATALTERVLDAVVLILFGLLALSGEQGIPPELLVAARAFGAVALVALMVLVLLSRLRERVLSVVERLPVAPRHRERLHDFIGRFLLGLGAFQQPLRAIGFGLLTLVIQALDVLSAAAVARSLGLAITLPQVLLFLAALGLASAVPSTPGMVGIYQFVARLLLPVFGVEDTRALAYALVLQSVVLSVVGFWGAIGAWRLGVADNHRRREAEGSVG
jgi:uncharacterized protein (TIRG00374 family)